MLGLPAIDRTLMDLRDTFYAHIDHILSYQNERRALLDIRRVGCWYLRLGKGTKALREGINRSKSLKEALDLIYQYTWELASYTPEEIPSQQESEACC
jgi:tRNA-dihydrouridine synthase